MSKKISYSAWKKYHTCPKYFDFHYNEKLRPIGTSSALVFGVAIDEALNALLLEKKDPLPVFQEFFKFENMKDVVWDDRDFDAEILTTEQLHKLSIESDSYKSWASMRVKGRMMLEAYIEQIYPLIKEVHSVQKELDDRPGILDAIVTLEGMGKVLIDHKTSARPYKPTAVVSDTQLALYAASEGLTKAGFIVLVKQIQKNRVKICSKCSFDGSFTRHRTCPKTVDGIRCKGAWNETLAPEAQIQVIIDDIPPLNKELITTSIKDTEALIEASTIRDSYGKIVETRFPRNLDACGKIYGKPCPYINKCWKNEENGLQRKENVVRYNNNKEKKK